ncbi:MULTISPECIES: DUF7660 family protein [Pseudomonas]|uniref:DUF7660 family protein n=1 Tax=Pseudomonas TaxID=286 RepID=UPI0006ACBC27
MELHDILDQVNDDQTFLRFARALMADRAGASSDSMDWENNTIEGFLENAIAWAEDTDFGIRQGLEQSNPWQQFAVFLYCGKIYE